MLAACAALRLAGPSPSPAAPRPFLVSAACCRAATELEDLINPVMPDVGLEGATFKVLVEEAKALGPAGADRVQFLLEANQGQTRGTVDAVASSGEKSRLLLLLETRLPPPQAQSSAELAADPRGTCGDGELAVAGVDGGGEDMVTAQADGAADVVRAAPCAVLYDEIDAHVGGRTAVAVGRLLANQGRDSQVCVEPRVLLSLTSGDVWSLVWSSGYFFLGRCCCFGVSTAACYR